MASAHFPAEAEAGGAGVEPEANGAAEEPPAAPAPAVPFSPVEAPPVGGPAESAAVVPEAPVKTG